MLLRTDLIKQHWKSYVFVCAASLAIHLAWAHYLGLAASTDFQTRYDPGARALLAHVGIGTGSDYAWIGYGATRIGYMSFVAVCYALFGVSLESVVYPQLALVWLVYPLMFHILLHITGRHAVSLGAMCVWLTYYDGYQWQFWGLPDALYRLMFLAGFFLILRLWQTGRQGAFVAATIAGTVIGTLFRIETVIYALPAAVMSLRIVQRRKPAVLWAGAAAGVLAAWAGRHLLGTMFSALAMMEREGWVLPGTGYDIPGLTTLAHPRNGSLVSWALFFAHLAAARAWHAVTPLPSLWSRAHRLYYCCYLTAFYALAVAGFLRARATRDLVFFWCLWFCAGAVILQMIVAVDASMRYSYTPQVFLFFCAVKGWIAVDASRRDASPAGALAG